MGSGRRPALIALAALVGLAFVAGSWIDDVVAPRHRKAADPALTPSTADAEAARTPHEHVHRDPVRTRGRGEAAEAARKARRRAAAEKPEGGFDAGEDDDPPRGRVVSILSSEPPSAILRPDPVEAALDVDPVSGETPEAPGGVPPEMDIEHFMEHGPRAVEKAVELVGERRPELEKGVPVSVTGRVVAKETGEPIEGASVVLTSTFYVRSLQYDHHLREVARVETDAEGAFHVERLNADPAHFGEGGRVDLTVTATDHAPALARPLAKVAAGFRNRLPDIELVTETHTLRGRVLCHWNDDPVAGALVIATGAIDPVAYPKDQRDALFVGAPATVTGDDGTFELRGLGPGVQTISLHAGDDCVGVQPVRVPSAADVTIRALPIRGRIAGRVLDAHGDPVPLVLVQGGWNSTHSFADGRFVLENFRGDRIDLAFSHTSYEAQVVRAVADGSEGLEVRLVRRWPVIRLSIRRHDDDRPVERVRITLEVGGEHQVTVPGSPVYLSKEGVHRLRVPAGVVRATVSADGLAPRRIDLASVQDGDRLDVLLTTAPDPATPGPSTR